MNQINFDYSSYQSPSVASQKNNVTTFSNGLVYNAAYKGKLSSAEINKVVENYSVYKLAADYTGIPWKMLAAVHYRETSLSIKSNPHGGPFRFDKTEHHANEEEFIVGAYYAARLLQEKSGHRLDPTTTDPHIIKTAFFRYNGTGYGTYDKSPYVMNGFDNEHSNMRVVGTDIDKNGHRFPVNIVDRQMGAYVFYQELNKAFP
ncbi:MAG TPA: hypothetical protein DDW49_01545 [Deltaproteobacteria bacterium]|nr:hypothetical protein [Deltaproteobacteria bacterium]